MPTNLHGPGTRKGPSTGQLSSVAHARPSRHWYRIVPRQDPAAQSSSTPHGAPGAPRCSRGAHTYGPNANEGLHSAPPHSAVPWHAEQTSHWHTPLSHSAFPAHPSPSSRERGGTQSIGTARWGGPGSSSPHTRPPVHVVGLAGSQPAQCPIPNRLGTQNGLAQSEGASHSAPSGAGPPSSDATPSQPSLRTPARMRPMTA